MNPSESVSTIGNGPIDFSRWFIPQVLTHLYYTAAYAKLTGSQRLRYNQLFALYFNEQTMFFERSLAQNVLGYFLAQPLPSVLKTGLRQFIEEEQQHSAMFRRLNRQCAPAIYSNQDFHFIQVPALGAELLDAISRRPTWFPLLLWLMHLQEERALFFGRTFVKSADHLEPHFLAAQRKHLADEIGHVHWDEGLLDWVWPKTSFPLRWFNVRLLRWMIGEYFSAPKRAGLRVLESLVQEFPDLCTQHKELRRQLLDLETDQAFLRSLYSTENVPHTLKRFDEWPEFFSLSRVMPGYTPRGEAMP